MQKWPYADIGYINVEHFRSTPKKNDPVQKWEYLTVEAVFVSENAVIAALPNFISTKHIIYPSNCGNYGLDTIILVPLLLPSGSWLLAEV
jgi:hypothetical protein